MKKRAKVLLVFDSPYFTPRGYEFKEEFKEKNWSTERDIYKALKEKGTISASDLAETNKQSRAASILSGIFFPIWLYTPLYEQKAVTFILPVLGFALSSTLLIYTRQIPVLLHFYPAKPDVFLITGSYLLNVIAIYCLATVIPILLSGVLLKGSAEESLLDRVKHVAWSSLMDELKFLSSLIVACLPLMLFPAILSVNKLFGLGLMPVKNTPLYYQVKGAFLITSQVITLPFLTALIAYGRRLNGATAALAALMIFFISHIIYQLLVVGAIIGI